MGKTFAWFGLLRTRQDGGTWFGRKVAPGKTLVMSEEDRGTLGYSRETILLAKPESV